MDTFCKACLASVKQECKGHGIHIGRIITMRHASGNNLQFEIWQDGVNHGWISAHCSADAKFKFLCELLDKARKNPKLALEQAERIGLTYQRHNLPDTEGMKP